MVRTVWVLEAESPAVVLGSTQPAAMVDAGRALVAGVEVVRRRSGGGAVWVEPGGVTWVDVLIPASDPLWDRDVGRAAWWLGEAWASALGDLGVVAAEVHRGGLVRSRWSDVVCFAGLGPGEVTSDGRKAVGSPQRRTRAGARFQCAIHRVWDPGPLLAVLALDDGDRERAWLELAEAALAVDVATSDLVTALVEHLP